MYDKIAQEVNRQMGLTDREGAILADDVEAYLRGQDGYILDEDEKNLIDDFLEKFL